MPDLDIAKVLGLKDPTKLAEIRNILETWEKEAAEIQARALAEYHQTMKRVNELRARVASHRQFFKISGIALDLPKDIKQPAPNPTTPAQPSSAQVPSAGLTMAEAAFRVLGARGEMHGADLLKALAEGGLTVGGKQPMSTLYSTLRRDDRIEKVPKKRNFWRMKKP